jgi:hypothetical protein
MCTRPSSMAFQVRLCAAKAAEMVLTMHTRKQGGIGRGLKDRASATAAAVAGVLQADVRSNAVSCRII